MSCAGRRHAVVGTSEAEQEGAARHAREPFDEIVELGVGPVQVVEYDDERRLPGHGLEEVNHRRRELDPSTFQ
jgi:hypothetical protein